MKSDKTSEITGSEDIKKILEKGIEAGVFPCAAAGAAYGLGEERKEVIAYCGDAAIYPEKRKLQKNDYFDLASLTKPLAATLAMLCLVKDRKIHIDDKISSLLHKEIKKEKSEITLRHLLSHSSGLPAHRDY